MRHAEALIVRHVHSLDGGAGRFYISLSLSEARCWEQQAWTRAIFWPGNYLDMLWPLGPKAARCERISELSVTFSNSMSHET